MNKKTRADSKIEQLPPNQKECLERWLFEENVSYAGAASRLFEDFNVRVPVSSLCAWRQARAQERMLERIAASAQTANAVVAKFEENPADTYKALLGMVGKIAFDKALADQLDAETIYNFAKLILAEKKLGLQEQEVGLAREKFEFDAAKKCLAHVKELRAIASEAGLSQDAKVQKIRERLFGAAPE